MRLSTAGTLTLVALLVCTLGVGLAATPAAGQAAGQAGGEADPSTQQVITIDLTADGDAVWTIDHYYPIESEDDEAAFLAFGEGVVSGEQDSGYNTTRFESFADVAEESTGREMTIEDASWREPRVDSREEHDALEGDGEVGVLTYSFLWTDFADQDDQDLILGDVFQTDDGGTWLPALTEQQRLVIVPPSNYGVVDAQRAPSGGLLIWDGPHEFEPDELTATYIAGAIVGFSLLEWVAIVLILAGVAGAGYYGGKRRGLFGGDEDVEGPSDPGPSSMDTNGGSAPNSGTGSGPNSAAQPSESNTNGPSPTEEIDIELLSDEERVLRLLRQNGGRMKQASIVTETDWSNAKVSQLLSKMDDDEAINKLRIGRENLITLPEVDLGEMQ